MPANIPTFCGTVAVVGLPSVGKSTLVNSICGAYVSGVSPKPQFTQRTVRGIYTNKSVQIVFLDSPGFLKKESLYQLQIAKSYLENIRECDCVLFVLDSLHEMTENEYESLQSIAKNSTPFVIVLNKSDLGPPHIKLLSQLHDLDLGQHIISISSTTKKNITKLVKKLMSFMPQETHLYPSDYYTDQHPQMRIQECVRESLFFFLKKELPYSTYVEVDEASRVKNKQRHINVVLFVEKKSQIPILIGDKGSTLQKIRKRSEKILDSLFPLPIRLHMSVQMIKNWRKDAKIIKKYLGQE